MHLKNKALNFFNFIYLFSIKNKILWVIDTSSIVIIQAVSLFLSYVKKKIVIIFYIRIQ